MLKQIIGPSPAVFVIKKVGSSLFCRGGNENTVLHPNKEFVQFTEGASEPKPLRMTQLQLNELLKNEAKRKLTKNEKLIKSVVEQAELSRAISEHDFKNLEEMYQFIQKYKGYLRLKRFIPLSIVAPLTTTELSNAALGSKSVVLTIPGVIGYSLPAYFFFHMSYFYAPDKLKPICQAGKYTFGAGFMLVNYIVDELGEHVEEKIFGEIDINKTGGTIPGDIGTVNDLRSLLEDLKSTSQEFTRKTY